ncbi:hypothetical protein BKA70DRAFT_1570115 [Coprinopsis sp. MPI-PUGE-AT-0042]|nr:hypothetical protein BKA70DRAFT_1570115 [Coprinopsis sp. MPI-PUGE-AT-0042]
MVSGCSPSGSEQFPGYIPLSPSGWSPATSSPSPAFYINGGHFNDIGRDQYNTFHNAHSTYQFNIYSEIERVATLQEFLDWLSITNFRTILQVNLTKRTRGSGKWFLKSRGFRRWLKSNHGVLWVIGMPGAGKTVLAGVSALWFTNTLNALALLRSIVIEYLQKEYLKELAGQVTAHEILVCFAYYRYTEPTSVCDILAAFVRQALERAEHVLPVIEDLYLRMYGQHRLEGTRPSQEDLVELLLEISKHFKLAFYILEGLDEAEDEVKHHLLRILSSMNMHLLITSRPLPSLEAAFPSVDRFEVTANGDDIDFLAARMIEQNPVFRALLERERTLKEEMISSVKQKANGMFLHASLQLARLEQCRTVGDLRDQLVRFPPDINTLYANTLKRIMQSPELDADRGKTILLWAVFGRTPMSVEDLQFVLALNANGVFDSQRVIPQDSLVALCHGLVTVESETQQVRLVHLTVKVVLERLLLEIEPRPYPYLASACITRLMACNFHKSSISSSDKLKETLGKYRFLHHAYTSWAYYARRCESSDTAAQKTIETFLVNCLWFPEMIASDESETVDHFTQEAPDLGSAIGCAVAITQPWVRRGPIPNLAPLDFTGLHLAAWNHLPVQLSALVKKGHDCTMTTEKGKWTPLMAAAFQGCGTIVEQLFRLAQSAGRDISAYINAVNGVGQDALVLALEQSHYDVAKYILETPGFKIHTASLGGYRSALRTAARLGRFEAVELLLKVPGMRVNGGDKYKSTALSQAARHGRLRTLEALLRFPDISVNAVDIEGKDALKRAVEGGHTGIVEALIRDPRVRVNAADGHGRTALMEAAKMGRVEIVSALLKVPELDVNAANNAGHTALMDIKVDALDKAGNTALVHTSAEYQVKVEQLFRDRPFGLATGWL